MWSNWFRENLSLGILYMLGSGFCFVAVIGLVSNLKGSLPAAQASFIRYAIGLVFFIPFFFRRSAINLDKSNFWRYFTRSIFHSLGVIFWFYAMSKLPVAEVTAIGYMTPIFVTVGAVIFFKEKVSFWRISVILLAFFSVVDVIAPR